MAVAIVPIMTQAFVFFAVASELSLGLHDLMLSGCAYSPERHRQKQLGAMSANFGADTPSAGAAFLDGAEPGPAESFEFFVWSRCSFVATFVGMYALSPRLNAGLRDLLSGRISNKYIALSAFSEGLTIVGFYLASIAYGLFYQVAGSICAAPVQPRHRPRPPPLPSPPRAGGHSPRGGGLALAAAQPAPRVRAIQVLQDRQAVRRRIYARQGRLVRDGHAGALPVHV